ncbi:MAG: hypothetical protein ACKOA2_03945 [Ilumatobacteraceae bacterium]
MNDQPTDDDVELVSAYLDGHVDEVERARVESSPSLRALADELSSVRNHLAAPVSTPSLSSAIAAALTHHRTDVSTSTRWSPRRLTALVGTAAAGLLLVAVVAVSRGTDDELGSSGDAASAPLVVTVDEKTDDSARAATSDAAGGGAPSGPDDSVVATIDAIVGPASAPPVVADTTELLTLIGTVTDTGTTATSDCSLAPDEKIITAIIWVDTPAVVIADGAGRLRVVDAMCTELATAIVP